jgi:recombination protein RecA
MSRNKKQSIRNTISGQGRDGAMKALKELGISLSTVEDTDFSVPGAIPTGSLTLDILTNIGGYARGRIVEIYGPEASGKTTLALSAIVNAQRQGLRTAFIDVEHALDHTYAELLGIDNSQLDYVQPYVAEEALDALELMVESGAYGLVVLDSVAALVPTAEAEGDMSSNTIGLQARLFGKSLRKITPRAAKNNTTVMFLNQLRDKVGVMYGSPETTSGGNALKYYASTRLDIRRAETLVGDDELNIGNKTRVKVVKTKFGNTAQQKAEFTMYGHPHYGYGIDYVGELIDWAVRYNVLERAGAWYKFSEEEKYQGLQAASQALKEKTELMDDLARKVSEKVTMVRPRIQNRLYENLISYGL